MPQPTTLKVLHVAAPGRAGGLESVLLDLTGGLHRLGHGAVLAAVVEPGDGEHPVAVRAESLGVDVRLLTVAPRAYLHEYRQLLALIKRVCPEVVHTHGYRADIVAGLAATSSGVPWVSTVHGFTGGDRKNRIYEWLQIRSYRRAQAVVAVSRPIRQRLLSAGIRPDAIELLPNAWSSKPLLDRSAARASLRVVDGRPLIGWVGRLTREKGADLFVEALALIPHRNWQASIVGDGRERRALELQAVRLGIADQVTWHGMLSDAAAIYPAFDCWVLSSRTEGTPIALFEAMAAHVPAVVTAVGGVPDVVSGSEALVVGTENPAAIAGAIAEVLAKPEEAAARAEVAHRKLLKEFAVGPWLDAHVALYQTLSMRGIGGHDV